LDDPVRFSVIVPTHDRHAALRRCLAGLVTAERPREGFEVLVVDDGSRTPVGPFDRGIEQALRLRILRRSQGGPGAARNTGAAEARGPVLVFTADDCVPARDWLMRLAERTEAAPEHLVGGSIENGLPNDLFATCNHRIIEYLYEVFNADPDQARFFTPNNMALPARGFARIGGFDESIGSTGEDRDLCHRWHRAGMPMCWASEAVVRHEHPQSLFGFLRQQYAYGRGSGRFHARRHHDAGERTPLIPEKPSFYARLVLHPLDRERSRRAALESSVVGLAQFAIWLGVLRERLLPSPFDPADRTRNPGADRTKGLAPSASGDAPDENR